MPYKLVGKTIYTKSSGKWKKKQTCKSVANAKKALRLLRGLEHGSIQPNQSNNSTSMAKKTSKKSKKSNTKAYKKAYAKKRYKESLKKIPASQRKLGAGGRFKAIEMKAAKAGMKNPAGVAYMAGVKAHGKKAMARYSKMGRKKKST